MIDWWAWLASGMFDNGWRVCGYTDSLLAGVVFFALLICMIINKCWMEFGHEMNELLEAP